MRSNPTQMNPPSVLWIDDDVRTDLPDVRCLIRMGYNVECATTAADGLARARLGRYDAILLDLHLPDQSGLDVLERFSALRVVTPVVVVTGFGDVESAVLAMKLGASDYRQKPVHAADIASVLQRVCAAPSPARRTPDSRWIEVTCDRLALCGTREECLALICRLILDRRLPLPVFVGAARAVCVLLTSDEGSVALLTFNMRHEVMATLKAAPPRHSQVCDAMTTLERLSRREEHLARCSPLNISRAYLNRLVLAETGRHYHGWMKVVGMRAAVRRLLETSDRISQVAYDVGYQHASHFDRDFADTFGVSPREFRKRRTDSIWT